MNNTPHSKRSLARRSLALLIPLTLVAAACGGDDDTADTPEPSTGSDTTDEASGATGEAPPTSGEPYKVGVVLPLSGAVAFIGTPMRSVIEGHIDYINELGGINGRLVELIVEDDGGDAARSSAALRSLKDQGVSAVVGIPLASGIAQAGPTAEEIELTLLTVGAVPSAIRENPKYLFQMDATSGSDAEPMTRFVTELLADDDDIRIALAPHDSPSSVEWGEAIEDVWAAELGVEVVANVTVPLAAADVTAQAQQIVSGEPDAVLVQGGDAGMPVLTQRLRSLGYEGPVVAYHGAGADATLRNLGDPGVYAMREVRSFDEDPADYPGLARYLKIVEQAEIRAPLEELPTAVLGTMLALVLEGALGACADPCDSEQFNAAISNLSLDTNGLTYGSFEYSETDHQGLTTSAFYHFVDGEILPALDGMTFNGDVYSMVGAP